LVERATYSNLVGWIFHRFYTNSVRKCVLSLIGQWTVLICVRPSLAERLHGKVQGVVTLESGCKLKCVEPLSSIAFNLNLRPYIEGATKAKTDVLMNDNDPVWNEVVYLLVDDISARTLSLQIMDSDEGRGHSLVP